MASSAEPLKYTHTQSLLFPSVSLTLNLISRLRIHGFPCLGFREPVTPLKSQAKFLRMKIPTYWCREGHSTHWFSKGAHLKPLGCFSKIRPYTPGIWKSFYLPPNNHCFSSIVIISTGFIATQNKDCISQNALQLGTDFGQ